MDDEGTPRITVLGNTGGHHLRRHCVVISRSITTTITLNGAPAYTTNVAPENRAACG